LAREGHGAGALRALILVTLAYVLCFAARSLTSPLAPLLTRRFGLSPTQAGLLVAMPLFIGIIARVPTGALADRFGSRRVYVGLLTMLLVPVALIGTAKSYGWLMFWSFWLGIGNAAFPVGIPYLAGWFPERKGFALGVYGLGGLGLALADFFAPRLAESSGGNAPFLALLPLLAAAALAFWLLGADPPSSPARQSAPAKRLSDLRSEPAVWGFCFIGLVTLGDLLGFSVYVPTYLAGAYELRLDEAAAYAAGFASVASLVRPLAGRLADRFGGFRVLDAALAVIAVSALSMDLLPGRAVLFASLPVLALGIGVGTAALWKLVAERFPQSSGTVTGLVGAAGGLGAFLVPALIGWLRQATGGFALGFTLLTALALLGLGTSLLLQTRPADAGPPGQS
jgi:NNP family nitrate/nitrite transporter-like MFS transporter